MNETQEDEKKFVGYEYKELVVKRKMESIYTDNYPSFGWEAEGVPTTAQGGLAIALKFKRNRKLRNKAEITRLQRQFDAMIAEIERVERSKFLMASIVAYVVGVIGTAFMAGSVFAVTGGNIILCVILAIPGFIGWIIPYLLYRNISNRKINEVNPVIEKKYDALYEICDQSNDLLSGL